MASYQETLIATGLRLLGKDHHGSPLHDANLILRHICGEEPGLSPLLGATPAEVDAVVAWMGVASKVPDLLIPLTVANLSKKDI